MKILFLLAFLPLCISNQDHQELQENLKLVIIDDQVKKDIIFQVKSELKEELSDILTEEFSQRLFGVFSRITNATASQAKNELKSEIKEELIEELTTELIFESDQSRIMNGPIVERDDCKAVKFLSLNRLKFDMVYENNKDCYAEIRFEREIDLKLSILNFFVSKIFKYLFPKSIIFFSIFNFSLGTFLRGVKVTDFLVTDLKSSKDQWAIKGYWRDMKDLNLELFYMNGLVKTSFYDGKLWNIADTIDLAIL